MFIHLFGLFVFCVFRTPFGKECELSAHTFLDSHKAEQDNNHWLFFMAHPASQNQSLMQQDSEKTDEQRESQEDMQVNEINAKEK